MREIHQRIASKLSSLSKRDQRWILAKLHQQDKASAQDVARALSGGNVDETINEALADSLIMATDPQITTNEVAKPSENNSINLDDQANDHEQDVNKQATNQRESNQQQSKEINSHEQVHPKIQNEIDDPSIEIEDNTNELVSNNPLTAEESPLTSNAENETLLSEDQYRQYGFNQIKNVLDQRSLLIVFELLKLLDEPTRSHYLTHCDESRFNQLKTLDETRRTTLKPKVRSIIFAEFNQALNDYHDDLQPFNDLLDAQTASYSFSQPQIKAKKKSWKHGWMKGADNGS